MSDSEETSEGTNIKKKQKCRKQKRSDRQIRERNKNAMRLIRSLKRNFEDNTVQQEPKQKSSSNYQMNKNEKNKTAMQVRREYDMEYRMKENHRNKLAMRLRRKVGDYRDRENQRNRESMQMRRGREKEKPENTEEVVNVKVEMSPQINQ